jgi:hypothetical protein
VTRHGCERGNSSKGKRRREERGPTHPGVDHDHFGGRRPRRASVWVSGSVPWWRVSAKRDEPQDWQRDATSPQSFARRKPSRWCETTRAERGWTGGAVGPWLFGAAEVGSRERSGLGSGRALDVSVEGRFQVANPKRGRVPVSRRFGVWSHREGPGCRAEASKETARACRKARPHNWKGQGVPKRCGSPRRSDTPVTSSRAPDR